VRALLLAALLLPATAHADALCYAAVGTPSAPAPQSKAPPSWKAQGCADLPSTDRWKQQVLLGGRLAIPFPESKDAHEPMAKDVMGPRPSELSRARLGWHLGDHGLVVIAEDLAQTAPGTTALTCHFSDGTPLSIGTTEQALKDFGKAMYEADPTSLPRAPSGLRVTAFAPKGQAARDRVGNKMIAGAVVELPDGTLVRVDVGVGALVNEKPCVAVALELLSRLTVGPSPLSLAGGTVKLGRYTIDVPPSNVLFHNPGPDFDEYELKRYGPLAAFSGFLQITLERAADAPKIEGDQKANGSLFGKPVTYRGTQRGRGRTVGIVVPAPDHPGHVVRVEAVATRDPGYLDELLKIAATLRKGDTLPTPK
jgi:hypothetical protein